MHYLVIFFAILIIFVILLLNQKVNILLQYERDRGNDNILLSFFTFGGLLKYKRKISLIKTEIRGIKSKILREKGKKADGEKKKFDFKEAVDRYKYFKEFISGNEGTIKYLKRKTVIDEFYLNIIAGTGDAAYTGVLGGLLWTFAGTVEALLSNNFHVRRKKTIVKPDFNTKVFKVNSHCIFSLKMANIIVVTFKLVHCYVYKLLFKKQIKK